MINIFWISFGILVYHLIGYGILLKFLNLFKKNNKSKRNINYYPSITILCPAFNEEEVIEEKIKSFYNLDYPRDKIKMIVISDDSTDRTNEIVRNYLDQGGLELVIQKPRKGKQNGHNLVLPSLKTEFVLSTDANSIFKPDAVKQLVSVLYEKENIGMVVGALKLLSEDGQDSGEGIYWKYESYLKQEESKLYSIICANGALFLLKRELFTQIDEASSDDFERTLIVLKNGYIARYAPQAIVYEKVTTQVEEEIGRKVRIITQEWFALFRQLSVFKNPVIAFMLISHKLIRWIFPLFSLGILLSSILMYNNKLFLFLVIEQLVFYLIGLFNLIKQSNSKSNRLMNLISYITAMNYSAIKAFISFLQGKKEATWDTVREDN